MDWQAVDEQPSGLGESPFWHPEEQRLYWLDIPGRQLLRTRPGTGVVDRWDLPQDPGCVAPIAGSPGALVLALRDGIYRAPAWGGALERLAPALHDVATTRFNDGKCDALGRLWVGTIYEPRDAARAALYCLDMHASTQPALRQMATGVTTANGLAWSPDAAHLYWADTPSHTVSSRAFDLAGATLGPPQVFQSFTPKPPGWQSGQHGYGGRPDGAAVDVQGNYYCALFEGGRILKIAPDGAVLAEIPVPAQCPTMPCFGGPGLKTLFVTTARDKRPEAELQRWPQSGCVFAMPVEVPGLPVQFFQG